MNEPLSPDDPSITLPDLEPSPVPKRLEQVNTPLPNREKMRATRRRRAGCVIVVLAAFMCLACLFCGAFGYAYFQELGWLPRTLQQEEPSSVRLNVQKEKICEAVRIDDGKSFQGITVTCSRKGVDGSEAQSATLQVSGAYVASYGIVASSIRIWEYYPMTSELQVSVPKLKVAGLLVLPGRITDAEGREVDNLLPEERAAIAREVRNQLYQKVVADMETDTTIRKRCTDCFRMLLSAFGINPVLVEEGMGVS